MILINFCWVNIIFHTLQQKAMFQISLPRSRCFCLLEMCTWRKKSITTHPYWRDCHGEHLQAILKHFSLSPAWPGWKGCTVLHEDNANSGLGFLCFTLWQDFRNYMFLSLPFLIYEMETFIAVWDSCPEEQKSKIFPVSYPAGSTHDIQEMLVSSLSYSCPSFKGIPMT